MNRQQKRIRPFFFWGNQQLPPVFQLKIADGLSLGQGLKQSIGSQCKFWVHSCLVSSVAVASCVRIYSQWPVIRTETQKPGQLISNGSLQ